MCKSCVTYLITYLLTYLLTYLPMQIRKDKCGVVEPRFLWDNSSKSILGTLKTSQIWKSGANYCCSYGFRSLSSKRSTNVTQGTNMEITSLDRRASNRDHSNRLSSNQLLSPLIVFLSIPQISENLPFPSIISSLDHLLPGLTLWNPRRPDLHVIHIHYIHHSSHICIVYMM